MAFNNTGKKILQQDLTGFIPGMQGWFQYSEIDQWNAPISNRTKAINISNTEKHLTKYTRKWMDFSRADLEGTHLSIINPQLTSHSMGKSRQFSLYD